MADRIRELFIGCLKLCFWRVGYGYGVGGL